MNRQTYPVHCGWCNVLLEHTSHVENSTGICSACLEDLRAEAQRQFTPTLHDPTGPIKGAMDMDGNSPWDDLGDRQELIEHAGRHHRQADFVDGFLIGCAIAIFFAIFADWLLHRLH